LFRLRLERGTLMGTSGANGSWRFQRLDERMDMTRKESRASPQVVIEMLEKVVKKHVILLVDSEMLAA